MKRMASRCFDDLWLPASRDRAANTVTWRQWWDQRFGAEVGMTLDEYCRMHGIA